MISIASIFNTTYESVSRIRQRLRRFELTGIDDRKKPGPKPLQAENEAEIAKFVRVLLEEHPEMDQKAVGKEVAARFRKSFGQSTVSRLMKNNGIPHKQMNQLYKKTRMISTHPEGYVMPLEEAERAGSSANQLVQLAIVASATEYKNPYALPSLSQGRIEFRAEQFLNLKSARLWSIFMTYFSQLMREPSMEFRDEAFNRKFVN